MEAGEGLGFDYLWVPVICQSGFFEEAESGQACRLEIQVGVNVSVMSLKFIEQICSLQTRRILC